MSKIDRVWKIIVSGVAFGIIFHLLLVVPAYYSVKSSVRKSKFTETIFKDDPSIGVVYALGMQDADVASKAELNRQITWRFLVNLNVIDWNSSDQDISVRLKNALNIELQEANLKNNTTVQHLINVSQRLGGDVGKVTDLEDIIVSNIAHGPRALEHYQYVVKEKSSANYWENPLAFLLPRELNPLWGEKSSQGNVISLLFIHSGIGPTFYQLPERKTDTANPKNKEVNSDQLLEPSQVYRQINEYYQRLFITIHDDPDVISAKNWLTIIEGPEQFFMYCVFGIGIVILLQHYRETSLEQKTKRFTVTLYQWIQIALPSLGFIGTKRGLSEALSRADSIVRAGSPVNQSLAVSHVSETMGVAFTSTLVGLVLLMLLMIFELFLKYKRESWNEQ